MMKGKGKGFEVEQCLTRRGCYIEDECLLNNIKSYEHIVNVESQIHRIQRHNFKQGIFGHRKNDDNTTYANVNVV